MIARHRRRHGAEWGDRDEHARAIGLVVHAFAFYEAAHVEMLRKLEAVWHAQDELRAARDFRARTIATLRDAIRAWNYEREARALAAVQAARIVGGEPTPSPARRDCTGDPQCGCGLCRLFSVAVLGPDKREEPDPRPERYGAF